MQKPPATRGTSSLKILMFYILDVDGIRWNGNETSTILKIFYGNDVTSGRQFRIRIFKYSNI